MQPKHKTIGVRMNEDLIEALRKDADRSGLTVSEQIRFELAVRRGLWRQPILPGGESPTVPQRRSPRPPTGR